MALTDSSRKPNPTSRPIASAPWPRPQAAFRRSQGRCGAGLRRELIDDSPQIHALQPTLADGLPLNFYDEAVCVSRNPAIDLLDFPPRFFFKFAGVGVLHHLWIVVQPDQQIQSPSVMGRSVTCFPRSVTSCVRNRDTPRPLSNPSSSITAFTGCRSFCPPRRQDGIGDGAVALRIVEMPWLAPRFADGVP